MKVQNIILVFLFTLLSAQLFSAEIIFSGKADGQFDLYQINTDFSHVKRLTNAPSNEMMPTISSNGNQLAFISDRDGANSIYLKSLLAVPSKLKNISAGIGEYANPAFSPDNKLIAVRYSPDPQAPLIDSRIVLLNPNKISQKTIVDSNKIGTASNSETINVVDRPIWISNKLLAYVVIEYSNVSSGKVSKSTIYMLDISKNITARIAGGESYFDVNGKPMGFKATMPSLISNPQGKKMITFVATRGAFNRYAMKYILNGKGKGKIEINDEDFFGPLLFDGKNWIYGYLDNNGTPGIAIKRNSLQSKREVFPFKGKALSPILVK